MSMKPQEKNMFCWIALPNFFDTKKMMRILTTNIRKIGAHPSDPGVF